MSTYLASLARKVGDAADFVHRAAAPPDDLGAEPVPSFLKQAIDDIQTQVVRYRPFSLSDLPAYIDAVKNLNGVGLDDRKFLLEKILVLMSRMPDDSHFSKSLQSFVIDTLYKDLPHPPAAYIAVPPLLTPPSTTATAGADTAAATPRYAARTADGTYYNPLLPALGAAGSPYARSVGTTRLGARVGLPDAGLVFDVLLKRPAGSASNRLAGGREGQQAQSVQEHPGGISSLFFAFADLVIHSIFHTDARDPWRNAASSYLDLSPLYGSSESEVLSVRRIDGRGRLWEDVFADSRILFMPPSVCALLVLFCRNHNFIADKLLAINEAGTYTAPHALPSLSDTARRAQDDEIFARARLVNCGFFMQVILGDYVGAILGLVRDGLDWRLDPLGAARESDHTVSPRGEGNVVSIEFNLLYRWHATLSEPDTRWTEKMFQELFEGKDFGEITPADFRKAARTYMAPKGDVKTWDFDGASGAKITRDAVTGRFADGDLAEILHNATEASAGAFRARGIPEVLRVVEVMGIEQSRAWGTCSLNEFRKFMGLKPYASFKEWNPDPAIYSAAESLYDHIDNLELHVGMQAEEAKPAIPGSGLCPGYTISRAILADAVALTRGDPFLTTEFTTHNLTSWGYQDCFPDKNDGSYGGMLTRLLFRTLPEYYPVGSVYAHFPFLVPGKVKGFLGRLRASPAGRYTYSRPGRPVGPVVTVESLAGVRGVLSRGEVFESGVTERVGVMIKGGKVDFALVNNVLSSPKELAEYGGVFLRTTRAFIGGGTMQHGGRPHRYVDIIKDVVNLVPAHFVATHLAGIPVKSKATPNGIYQADELFHMFADVCNYVYLNTDPGHSWVLREKSTEAADVAVGYIHHHLQKIGGGFLSLGGLADSVVHWVSGEDTSSHAFLKRAAAAAGTKYSEEDVAKSVFAVTAATAAPYAAAVARVVDFYLDETRAAALKDIAGLCRDASPKSDAELMRFVREALRLNPPVSGTVRTARSQATLSDGWTVQAGQKVYCSITAANLDSSVFGTDAMSPNYERAEVGVMGIGEHGLVSSAFFEATAPQVLRAIFTLKNLSRAPGQSGRLYTVAETRYGYPDVGYLDFKGQVTPFPASLIVQYDDA